MKWLLEGKYEIKMRYLIRQPHIEGLSKYNNHKIVITAMAGGSRLRSIGLITMKTC